MLLTSKRMAYLGLILALNQIVLFSGQFIPTNTIAIYALAALMIGVIIVEMGLKSGISFYIASSILAFLLTGDKIRIITYIGFFGLYSIAKYIIEDYMHKKQLSMVIELVIKGILFNIMLVIYYYAMGTLVKIPITWWLILGAEVAFYAYDYVFGYFMVIYMHKIKPYIKLSRR